MLSVVSLPLRLALYVVLDMNYAVNAQNEAGVHCNQYRCYREIIASQCFNREFIYLSKKLPGHRSVIYA
jgi:hypothetical protein